MYAQLCRSARPCTFHSTGLGRFEFGCDSFPGFDTRPVAFCSQAIGRLSGGLGTPARAKARTEHPGVNSYRVINVDPHSAANDTFARIKDKSNCRALGGFPPLAGARSAEVE
jgi:hypothetical protein